MTYLPLALLIIFIVLFGSLAYAALSIAPWVPARKKDLELVNKLCNLKPGQNFYEIGSGDGRVSFYIAQRNPEAKIIGIEMALPMYLYSRIKLFFLRLKNVELRYGNALLHDMSDADVVYTFALIKTINHILKEKFLKELSSGATIVSYVFSINEWPGESESHQLSNNSSKVHVYKV